MEITYWRSAKVPTVQYGARDICLTLKTEVKEGQDIDTEYQKLKSFVDERVEAQANAIANDISGLRIREKNGKKYPSVTTILTPDKPQVPNIEKYGLKGTEYHRLCNHYLLTRTHLEPQKEIDIAPLKWDIDVKGFFEKFGSEFSSVPFMDLNKECFNEKHLYSGEIDYYGMYEGKPTIGDFKTGTWKLEQLVAYYKCNPKEIQQLAIFDLKKNEVLTWDVNSPEVQEAWEKFLLKRGAFRQRFGI